MSRSTSLHTSIACTIVIGQFLGLMPLCGIFHQDESHLKVTWRSLRFCYTVIVLFGSVLFVLFIIVWIITTGVTLNNLLGLCVYLSCLLNVILFFKLAMKWPGLLKLWRCIDFICPSSDSFTFPKHSLKLKMNLVATVVIGISIGK